MLRRIAVLLAIPLAFAASGSPAQASCADDFADRAFDSDAYAVWDSSDHYLNWVYIEGTATVVVEGDDLLWDANELVQYLPELALDYVGNAPGNTVEFVDCVAG